MNITTDSESWIGSTLVDSDDRKLGRIEAIYFDQETGMAQWMAVKTGLFGNKHTFVPLEGAMALEDGVMTPYDKNQIDDAPTLEPDEDLPDDLVRELYGYFGLPYDEPVYAEPAAVERDDSLMATEDRTQSQDDMRVATGHRRAA